MVAYVTRMPVGIQGAISRDAAQATIEPGVFNPSTPFAAYGLLGKLDSNSNFVPLTDKTDVVYGILVRPYPTTGRNASDALGVAVPVINGICDVLRRGYIVIKTTGGTAKKGGQVYINATTLAFTADPTGNTAVPGAFFMGASDSNGFNEIAYNI